MAQFFWPIRQLFAFAVYSTVYEPTLFLLVPLDIFDMIVK